MVSSPAVDLHLDEGEKDLGTYEIPPKIMQDDVRVAQGYLSKQIKLIPEVKQEDMVLASVEAYVKIGIEKVLREEQVSTVLPESRRFRLIKDLNNETCGFVVLKNGYEKPDTVTKEQFFTITLKNIKNHTQYFVRMVLQPLSGGEPILYPVEKIETANPDVR